MRVFALITTAVLVAASTAHAGNTKYFPGTMCQGHVLELGLSRIFVGTTQVTVPYSFFRPASYFETGAVHNWSASAEMTMVCPIVRDEVRGDGLGWSSLTINVLNTSASRSLSCKAETFHKSDHRFGTIIGASVRPDTDWIDVLFSAPSVPLDGYMLISCIVPRVDSGDAPSGIASYRIDE